MRALEEMIIYELALGFHGERFELTFWNHREEGEKCYTQIRVFAIYWYGGRVKSWVTSSTRKVTSRGQRL